MFQDEGLTDEVPDEKRSKMSELPPPSLHAPTTCTIPVQALPPDPTNPSPGQLTAEKVSRYCKESIFAE